MLVIDDVDATFSFRCPGCGWIRTRTLQPQLVSTVVAAGSRVVTHRSGGQRSAAPAITEDEIDRFRVRLDEIGT